MNQPLPNSMPWRAKAEIMVRRGEATDFSDACAKLRRRKHGCTTITAADRAAFANVESLRRAVRLPYADN